MYGKTNLINIDNLNHKIKYLNTTHFFTHAPTLEYPLLLPYEYMVLSLERGDILAKTLTNISSQSLQYKDHSPSMTLKCCLWIHDLVPQLLPTKSDDRPYEYAKVSLQVAFYDHPMSLQMSLYIQRIKLPINQWYG